MDDASMNGVIWGNEHLTDAEFDTFLYLNYIIEMGDENLSRLENKKSILKADWKEMKSYMRAIRFTIEELKQQPKSYI
jgi:hypothetical protein